MRLVVCNLDVVGMRIIEFVQSRLMDEEYGRMETIPVLLTVDDGTVENVGSLGGVSIEGSNALLTQVRIVYDED